MNDTQNVIGGKIGSQYYKRTGVDTHLPLSSYYCNDSRYIKCAVNDGKCVHCGNLIPATSLTFCKCKRCTNGHKHCCIIIDFMAIGHDLVTIFPKRLVAEVRRN